MNRIIELCARNKFMVFLFTGVLAMIVVLAEQHKAGRDP